MASYCVLLVNVDPGELRQLEALFYQFDPEVHPKTFSSLEAAESELRESTPVLVILGVDDTRKRPDQDIHRIRRLLSKPVPILLLISQSHVARVRDYLRAGADEYWILPIDDHAFPPRLQVLVEWGTSVSESENSVQLGGGTRVQNDHLVLRLWKSLKRGFSLSRRSGNVSAEAKGLIANKWERIKRLGFGSFGEVWLVQEAGGSAQAVAKIPHSQKLNTKFIREAAILKRLAGHPNAVQLKEVVKEDGKVIMIQEYVQGTTLQDLLGTEMTAAMKEKAFLDLLEVVAFAHRQNIMHRDIKPENIIITDEGTLKLLDFGTGKDLTKRSISNTVIGSRPFMAPEQIMGSSRLASDIWALGVILYALATTCLPFYDDNEKQLMDIILESRPERPRNLEPELHEALEAIILKCLEKDWQKRYRNASELQEELLRQFPDFGQGKFLS